uniref:ATP synthase F0 subunit 8 n=1 Tax=Picromerus viridipunctatus TaxID=2021723 RepID=UPI002E773C86|nr:ATP synthase F0 subunit 8 [Picromerus viridipunctatus]WPO01479.1 ATP synthase F0 subunit 8 [Picromerus viridipunctatus]
MPQMSPLWWEILFIVFLLTYMMHNILIYFNKKNNLYSKTFIIHKKVNNSNWMW